MVNSARSQGNRSHVDPLKDRAVVFLIEGDIEDFIGRVGKVKTRHPHHKHKSSLRTRGDCELVWFGVILHIVLRSDDLFVDSFESHAGK